MFACHCFFTFITSQIAICISTIFSYSFTNLFAAFTSYSHCVCFCTFDRFNSSFSVLMCTWEQFCTCYIQYNIQIILTVTVPINLISRCITVCHVVIQVCIVVAILDIRHYYGFSVWTQDCYFIHRYTFRSSNLESNPVTPFICACCLRICNFTFYRKCYCITVNILITCQFFCQDYCISVDFYRLLSYFQRNYRQYTCTAATFSATCCSACAGHSNTTVFTKVQVKTVLCQILTAQCQFSAFRDNNVINIVSFTVKCITSGYSARSCNCIVIFIRASEITLYSLWIVDTAHLADWGN